MNEKPKLYETEHLWVRRLDAADYNEMYAVYSDAEAMRWVGDGLPIEVDVCYHWIEVTKTNYEKRGYGMSALVLKESGVVIGFCGVVHPNGQAEPEIKYALLWKHWGKGLATEAVRGMLDYVSREHGLKRIIATTDPENEASHRVLQKCGLSDWKTVQNKDGSSTRIFVWEAGAAAPEAK